METKVGIEPVYTAFYFSLISIVSNIPLPLLGSFVLLTALESRGLSFPKWKRFPHSRARSGLVSPLPRPSRRFQSLAQKTLYAKRKHHRADSKALGAESAGSMSLIDPKRPISPGRNRLNPQPKAAIRKESVLISILDYPTQPSNEKTPANLTEVRYVAEMAVNQALTPKGFQDWPCQWSSSMRSGDEHQPPLKGATSLNKGEARTL